jgi:hypothetical protein
VAIGPSLVGAFYEIETQIAVANGSGGGSYIVGQDSWAGNPLPFVPAAGIVHQAAVSWQGFAGPGLPGAATYTFGIFSALLASAGDGIFQRGIFAVTIAENIDPSTFANLGGQGPAGNPGVPGTGSLRQVRTPDVLLNAGYPYGGRFNTTGQGVLNLTLNLDGAAAQDEYFRVHLVIEGRDTLEGSPGSFYRTGDPFTS